MTSIVKWDELVTHLRAKFPTRKRLVIRRVEMARRENFGKTTDNRNPHINETDGQITITVDRNRPLAVQIDTLMHELAHAIDYDRTDDHGKQWGHLYSQVYKAYEEFLNSGPEGDGS